MADELKSDSNIVESKQTVEVLDMAGKTMTRDTPLASIFDKIEQGKNEGKSAADVVKEAAAAKPETKEVKTEVKPEVKVEVNPDVKIEVKPEASSLDKKLTETQQAKDKKEVKPDDTEVSEDDLQVLPHDKPKTAKRIQKLLDQKKELDETVTKTRAEAQEKAAKVIELEKKLGEVKSVDPKVEEEVKKTREELAMFRRKYDLEKDPEVKTKFDSRMESIEKNLNESTIKCLQRHNAGEGLVKIIESEGGWSKFVASEKTIILKDGAVVTYAQLADTIMQQLPLSERRAIDAAMLEQIQVKRDKDRFFQEETAKANDFFKKKDEESNAQRTAYDNQIKEVASTIEKWHKDVIEKNAWLKEREIPANATAEQKAAIEDDNKFAKEANAKIQKSLSIKDVGESLAVVYDAVRFNQSEREKSKALAEVESLKKQLAAKQTEIDKFKGGARSVPKTGSIAGGGGPTVVKEEKPKTLEDAFAAIEQGKREEE